jgi:hypothetical protein
MEKADEDEQAARASKKDQQQLFLRICSNLIVEGVSNSTLSRKTNAPANEVVAEALKLAASGQNPKYFKGDLDLKTFPAALSKLALPVGDLPSGEAADVLLKSIYSDFLSICVAFKPRLELPPTLEDANFDAVRLNDLFEAASEEAHEESLASISRMVDCVLEQGSDQLASSPAKLRMILMVLMHPLLADSSGEPWTVLKQFLVLVKQIHADTAARDTLVGWIAALPLEVLDRIVSSLQTFLTVSLLMAQSEHSGVTEGGQRALQAMAEIGKSGDLARHMRNAFCLLDIYWRANQRRKDYASDWKTRRKAQLAKQLGTTDFDEESIRSLDVERFHNDAVNELEAMVKHDLREILEMQENGRRFATMEDDQRKDFGLIEFPFVLTCVSKVRMLNIESMIMQREEVRSAMIGQILRGRMSSNPFLVLKVRRNDVMTDALQQLASPGPQHFGKPLEVVFDGGGGVGEGGVQKEFFPLLVSELYNEDFGMFERTDESPNLWFNKNSFENDLQFELFGIVIGLAIYNQVILDVKFPMGLYKKLISPGDFELGLSDLMDFRPELAQGFIQLLEYDPSSGAAFEDVFPAMTFVVEYDCFGALVEVELTDGGKDIPVTMENREEYIKRYCEWIFHTGVKKQYKAFRKGFDQCIGDTLFRQLFRYDELEHIICGQPELDFEALEKIANYQDGYTVNSPQMRWFWEVVHSLSYEDQRALLQFCTGSDRAPVGGLGKIPFIISRAGPDSDALPTVHTCFNHILVPEYDSKEKLERLIRLAIKHCTGFGLM